MFVNDVSVTPWFEGAVFDAVYAVCARDDDDGNHVNRYDSSCHVVGDFGTVLFPLVYHRRDLHLPVAPCSGFVTVRFSSWLLWYNTISRWSSITKTVDNRLPYMIWVSCTILPILVSQTYHNRVWLLLERVNFSST